MAGLPLKLQAARLKATMDYPYFSTPILTMYPVESLLCVDPAGNPTMAVDKWWRWYYHPAIVDAWSRDELVGVLIHEVNHLIRGHEERCRTLGAENMPWNLAGDLEINDDLKEAGVKLPEGGAYPAELGMPENKMAEQYYEIVQKAIKKMKKQKLTAGQCGSGAGGQKHDCELDGGGKGNDPKQDKEIPKVSNAEGNMIRRDTANKVKQAGNVPGNLRLWAEELLKPPEIPWQKELQGAVRRCITWAMGAKEYTFRKSNRRYPNLIMPTMQAPEVTVAVYVDVSGSMLGPWLDAAMVEVAGIVKTCSGRGVKVASVDTVVGPVRKAFKTSDVELVGGGGTDMGAAIYHAEDQMRPTPDVVVVLTDGYTPWPKREPKARFKVIVCLIGDCDEKTVPKWARTIRVKKEG